MAVKVMDTIEPAGGFPVIQAKDVGMPAGERLSESGEDWVFELDDGSTVKKKVLILNEKV